MNINKVQTMLNKEVLANIDNIDTKCILKAILFNPANTIDWDEAYSYIMTFMPELNKYEGYKPENMN